MKQFKSIHSTWPILPKLFHNKFSIIKQTDPFGDPLPILADTFMEPRIGGRDFIESSGWEGI